MAVKRDPVKRFENKYIKSENGCWMWTATTVGRNLRYGYFWDGNRLTVAHRFAYKLKHGCIPSGMEVDHLCKQSLCVNPDHLEAVTHQTNIDRSESGRNHRIKTHCPSGHAYDEENTIRYDNRRYCRACRNNRKSNAINKGV